MLIDKLLKEDSAKDLLRLATAGSVDDGKSTLIGRLLYESKGIYEDQLEAIEKASEKVGSTGGKLDLALVTDGLKAEREQGITIDVVRRDGMWIMVDDDRLPIEEGEVPEMKMVRFRSLGCYPLTAAIESNATTLPEIIEEMMITRKSERENRIIDFDQDGSMEQKKREGYF